MAALGKIRSKGTILIIIIGIGLFGFIAGDFFKGCEGTSNASKQRIAEMCGEKVNAIDYQKYVERFVEAAKTERDLQMQAGMNVPELNDEELRNAAWQVFLSNRVIAAQAKKLGLQVTDAEVSNIVSKGQHQLLMSVPIAQFHNQTDGRFDVNALKQFLASYKQAQSSNPQAAEQMRPIYEYWLYKEEQLRNSLLEEKYFSLIQASLTANETEAKLAFNGEKQESTIDLAYFDYRSINDNSVKISDQDLQAKYEELKPRFYTPEEIREVKYVAVLKQASAADRKKLMDDMNKYRAELDSVADPARVITQSQSRARYIPVAVPKAMLPRDIAAKIDSMAVGSTCAPFETKDDNTFNVVRLMGKVSQPDSVEYRSMMVVGETPAKAQQSADSVFKALQEGADFEAIAKKYYEQTGQKQWITGMQMAQIAADAADQKEVIEALNTLGVGEMKNIKVPQGHLILKVENRKAMIDKYQVAVIKRTIDFSDETSQEYYNKFTQFVASNKDLKAIEANAPKAGYLVSDVTSLSTSAMRVANIGGTREALKWAYEAKVGDKSEVFKCGDNNDVMLMMVLTGIHPKGYFSMERKEVADMVRAEVLRDKKAEMLTKKLEGVKSIAAAKQKGAKVTTVEQITFNASTIIPELMANEPALSGAVYATKKGTFSSHVVKGLFGVYVFQVKDRKQLPGKYNASEYMQRCTQQVAQGFFSAFQEDLLINSEIKDNRYKF